MRSLNWMQMVIPWGNYKPLSLFTHKYRWPLRGHFFCHEYNEWAIIKRAAAKIATALVHQNPAPIDIGPTVCILEPTTYKGVVHFLIVS